MLTQEAKYEEKNNQPLNIKERKDKGRVFLLNDKGDKIGEVDVDMDALEFEDKQGSSSLTKTNPKDTEKKTNAVTNNIVYASEKINDGIVFSTNVIRKGIKYGSDKFIQSTKPNQVPAKVSDRTTKNLEQAKNLSTYALKTTTAVVGTIVSAGTTVGKGVINAVSKKDATHENISESVNAIGSVYDTLQDSIMSIILDGAMASENMVQHKFGDEAKEAVKILNKTFTNCTLVYVDFNGSVKKVVLKTFGKAVLKGALKNNKTSENKVVIESLPNGLLHVTASSELENPNQNLPPNYNEEKNSDNSGWNCYSCTFKNKPDAQSCEMCEQKKKN
ncbi:hypothetical protein HDU92_008098 [Lobulomyces angularis]|nr:hypothetical protein HDU92_008098 [Lobulomyces angularis]